MATTAVSAECRRNSSTRLARSERTPPSYPAPPIDAPPIDAPQRLCETLPMQYPGKLEYSHTRKIRERNTSLYRAAHWPIWIWVFFLAPGPLTFSLFAHGFGRGNLTWLVLVLIGTGIAAYRGKLPGAEPAPTSFASTKTSPTPSTAASATPSPGAPSSASRSSTSPASSSPPPPAPGT